ncbi:SdpI family protein [Clostridium hydrogenum]|uniref:SdpI family protein n=1 Tax=Clostridium hydrogenum TaxID=2855764 RepID=UPI001F396801|nr:SdpI family protein [Clostridium hydrogenum]
MLYELGMLFAIGGLIFKIFPPKKINGVYGYRTNTSMKNQDTWKVAQKYSANSMIILGIVCIVLGFILNQLIKNVNIGYQGIIVLIGVIAMLILDEVHLKKVFNKDGSRK